MKVSALDNFVSTTSRIREFTSDISRMKNTRHKIMQINYSHRIHLRFSFHYKSVTFLAELHALMLTYFNQTKCFSL